MVVKRMDDIVMLVNLHQMIDQMKNLMMMNLIESVKLDRIVSHYTTDNYDFLVVIRRMKLKYDRDIDSDSDVEFELDDGCKYSMFEGGNYYTRSYTAVVASVVDGSAAVGDDVLCMNY